MSRPAARRSLICAACSACCAGTTTRARSPPQPGLDQLAALIDSIRAAGMECELRTQGEPIDLTPGVDLVAYRVIEAALLTAAHHRASRALVTIRYQPRELELELELEICGGSIPDVDLSLRSIAQRVALYDGSATRRGFDLDEYVFDALVAGASGFLLKDVAPEQLLAGIRIIAQGDSLLSPSVTRRLIESFVRDHPRRTQSLPGLGELTARELEILGLLARGLSKPNRRTARRLEHHIKTHVARVLDKLKLRDRVQAVVVACETGIIRPGTEP